MNDPKELLDTMLQKQEANAKEIQKLQAELKTRTEIQLRLSGAIEALNLVIGES